MQVDLRYGNKDQGQLQVVVAPVLRFIDVGFNAQVRLAVSLRKSYPTKECMFNILRLSSAGGHTRLCTCALLLAVWLLFAY